MFVTLGAHSGALAEAAALCRLSLRAGPAPFRARSLRPNDLRLPDGTQLDPNRSDAVLSLLEPEAGRCRYRAHEVGLFRTSFGVRAVWDDTSDGFGLVSYVGPAGLALVTAYAMAAARAVAESLGLAFASGYVARGPDGETVHMEYASMQQTIKVRISPTGTVTVKTEGFEGAACQDATKQLQLAMGTVVSDDATAEMYSPPEQRVSAGA